MTHVYGNKTAVLMAAITLSVLWRGGLTEHPEMALFGMFAMMLCSMSMFYDEMNVRLICEWQWCGIAINIITN